MNRLTWKKIKNLLFGFTGTLIYCPYCKSPHVRTVGKSTIVEKDGEWYETYNMQCKDCKSKAKMYEVWVEANEEEKEKEKH